MADRRTTVVFDLGNVLIRWDRRLLFEQLIPDPDELQYFLDHVFTLERNQELDRGTSLAEVTAMVAADHPEHHDVIVAFGDRWGETLGGTIEGTVEILEALHQNGVPLLALSNWGADTFASIEADYPFFELFDGMVISGREGVIKPDPAIYRLVCERYDLEPADALFVDDSPANIEAAAGLGWDTILFRSPESLRLDLAARDLL